MIGRTIYSTIKEVVDTKPVTLITGARQVGKTTLCGMLSKEYGIPYVSLSDPAEYRLAKEDPEMFLKVHGHPLIIDEVQKAPGLFDAIEGIVDRERFENPDAHGIFILTGSQAYGLMEGVTQSMAGRVGIVNVPAISISEEHSLEEHPFVISPEAAFARCKEIPNIDLWSTIVRGMYPEVIGRSLGHERFYSDYVDTYIARDVSEMVNIQDKGKFLLFMQVVASLTGQELVYETITNSTGVDLKTAKRWLSVLEAGEIIVIVRPYSETSMTKRVSKRPKLYFRDTGLACYLAGIRDPKVLLSSYLRGPMTETFIVGEIMKTHINNGRRTPFYYYRDSNGNEIDFLMVYDGRMEMVECKSGITFGRSDIKAFGRLQTSLEKRGCIVCATDKPYPITEDVYAIPIRTIGH